MGPQQRLGRFANSMVARMRATTASLAMGGGPPILASGSSQPQDKDGPRPGSADASAHLSSTLLSGQTLEPVGGSVSTHYQEAEKTEEAPVAVTRGCV